MATLIKLKRGDTTYVDDHLLVRGEPAFTLNKTFDSGPQSGVSVSDNTLRIGNGSDDGGVAFLNAADSQLMSTYALYMVGKVSKNLSNISREIINGEDTIYNRGIAAYSETPAAVATGVINQTWYTPENVLTSRKIYPAGLDYSYVYVDGKLHPIDNGSYLTIPENDESYPVVYYLAAVGYPYLAGENNYVIDTVSTLFSEEQINNSFRYLPQLLGPYSANPYSGSVVGELVKAYDLGPFEIDGWQTDLSEIDSDVKVITKEHVIVAYAYHVPANHTGNNLTNVLSHDIIRDEFGNGKYGLPVQNALSASEDFFPTYNIDPYYMSTAWENDAITQANVHFSPRATMINFDRDIGTQDYNIDIDVISYSGSPHQFAAVEPVERYRTGFLVQSRGDVDKIRFKWTVTKKGLE